MNRNLKVGVILSIIVFIAFLFFLFSNKSSQYKNPESLQGIDESIFNR